MNKDINSNQDIKTDSKVVVHKKEENQLLSLLINVLIPSIILIKLKINPKISLLIALSFPIVYGIYFFITRKKYNFISILGFVNVILTGGLGILALSKIWFAVKEATLPLVIGIFILITMKSEKPLVRTLFFNDLLVNTKNINEIIESKSKQKEFSNLIQEVSLIVASSFFLSSVLNFVLAILILNSPPGSTEFNKDLGFMNLISYPVISGSCFILLGFAIYKFCKTMKTITGLEMSEILNIDKTKDQEKSKDQIINTNDTNQDDSNK